MTQRLENIHILPLIGLMLAVAFVLLPARAQAQVKMEGDRMCFGEELVSFPDFSKAVAEFSKVNIIHPDEVKGDRDVFIVAPDCLNSVEAYQTWLFMAERMGATFTTVGEYTRTDKLGWIVHMPSQVVLEELPKEIVEGQTYINFIYTMKHLPAEDVLKVMEEIKTKHGRVYAMGNKLLFIDLQSNLPRVLGILKHLDVGDASTAVYFWIAKNSPITDVADIVERLFMKAGSGKDAAVGLERIVTDERTNGLFIVGTPEACKRVLAFIPKLDIGLQRQTKMEVYFLKYAKASDMMTTLQGVTIARRSKETRQHQYGEDLEVKITADEQNNALILIGPTRGIASMKKVIAKLDHFPRQVFLEVVVLEVSVGDATNIGVSYSAARNVDIGGTQTLMYGGSNYGSINSVAINPTSLMGLAMGVQAGEVEGSGDAFNLGFNFPKFSAIIQMLQTSGKVNVVSNPYLMAMDAEEAEVIVGSNIPFITGTAMDSYNQPVLSIQRQDVAMTVKLKPDINERGRVKVKIEITEESLASMSETLGPTTTKRSIKSTAVAENGSRIALGGLIKEKQLQDDEKIPFLGDLPIFGRLFRTDRKSNERTNLMAVITPYIVDSPDDLKRIFKRKLEERAEYIREMYGKEDTAYKLNESYHDRTGTIEAIRQLVERQKELSRQTTTEGVIVITPSSADGDMDGEAETDVFMHEQLTAPPPNVLPPPPENEEWDSEAENTESDSPEAQAASGQ